MQEQERKSLAIYYAQGGFACLVALLKRPGRQHCSRIQRNRRRAQGLPGEKGEKKQ